MNYRRAPSDVYDDAEAMQRWAALAVEAGRRRPRQEAEAEETPSAGAGRRCGATSSLSSIEGRKRGSKRRVARLLIGIAQREDAGVVPFGADEAEADRKPAHLAHRHGEVRIAGDRGEAAGRAAARGWCRRGPRRSARPAGRVGATRATTLLSRSSLSIPSGAGEAQRGLARGALGVVEPARRLRLLEQVLAEQRHLLGAHARG